MGSEWGWMKPGSADINTSILPLLLVLLSPFYDHRRWGSGSFIEHYSDVISGGHIMASWENFITLHAMK